MGRQWWGSLFPTDHVYIERLNHSLEGKGIGGKKISASICLLHHDLPSEEKRHIRSVNLGEEMKHEQMSRPFFFLSRCPESRMYTFSSFFVCWLFIPVGNLQVARLGLMHLILVEGINKPKWIQSHFPVHLYIKVPFDLQLLYFYIYFPDAYKFGWGNTGCN